MKTIIAGVDLRTSTITVLAHASKIAKAFQAKLWVIHATSQVHATIKPEPTDPIFFTNLNIPENIEIERQLSAEKFWYEHRLLHGIQTKLDSEGVDATCLLIEGDAVDVLSRKAEELSADLLVVGSHGHGKVYDLILCGTCESVLRRAKCPVLVIPPLRRLPGYKEASAR